MTNKITGNAKKTDVQSLQAYYEALRTKKLKKDEKTEKALVNTDLKEVETSALEATAAQIWGVQLSKIDNSGEAVRNRMEMAMKNDPFFTALNELQGINEENNFAEYALANLQGVDKSKLTKELQKPLNLDTKLGVSNLMNFMTA